MTTPELRRIREEAQAYVRARALALDVLQGTGLIAFVVNEKLEILASEGLAGLGLLGFSPGEVVGTRLDVEWAEEKTIWPRVRRAIDEQIQVDWIARTALDQRTWWYRATPWAGKDGAQKLCLVINHRMEAEITERGLI